MGILAVVLIALGFVVTVIAKSVEGLLLKFLVLGLAALFVLGGYACVKRTDIHYKLCRFLEIGLALVTLAAFGWALLP